MGRRWVLRIGPGLRPPGTITRVAVALVVQVVPGLLLGAAEVQARGRLEIAKELREGGQATGWLILGVLMSLVLVALLRSGLGRILRRKPPGRDGRRIPLPILSTMPGGVQSLSPGRSTTPVPDAGALRVGLRGSTEATENLWETRCPKCYGKYNSQTEKTCPFCAEERRKTEEEIQRLRGAGGGPPQARSSRGPDEEGRATRFQEAERFNEEGVKLLRNIAPIFRVEDAIKKFNEAIRLAPRNASYFSNRGVAHFTNAKRRFSVVGKSEDAILRRDILAAIEDFTRAIGLRDNHVNYILWRAQAREFLGERALAREDYEWILRIEPIHTGALEAIDRMTAEEAASGLNEARTLAQRLTAEGMRVAMEEDPERGLKYLNDAIEADRSFSPAYLSKAQLLNKLNRMEESLATLEKAMEVNQQDIQSLLSSYQQKGLSFKKLERVGEAAELSSGEEKPTAVVQAVGGRGRGVTGSLSEMAVPDILQVLAAGQKTVRVNVQSHGSEGAIVLADGRIVDAHLDDQKGEEAFFRILTWMEGDFTVEPLLEPPEQTIHQPNEALILEGLRRIDEATRSEWRDRSDEGM